MRRTVIPAAIVSTALLLSACATNQTLSNVEYDPWEGVNRNIHSFNDTADRVILKPIATGYRKFIPRIARLGVSNFFDNLMTPRSAINNFLQGKPKRGLSDVGRFLFNSTFGIAGLLDVASDAGLEEFDEDFGQTLATWGVPNGPYVVLPFLGPRTLRDALSEPIDVLADPLFHYDVSSVRDKLWVLRGIDLRAGLLSAEALIADSKDRYITLRESYLQNREYEVYDGDPPIDDDFYDDFEDFEEDTEESN